MTRKKAGDPRRTPELIVDLLAPQLEAVPKWTRSTHTSFQCESEDEAVAVVRELKRRGWKAFKDVGVSLSNGKGWHYAVITGPSKRAAVRSS